MSWVNIPLNSKEKLVKRLSDLGFNVPPITRSYEDGTSVLSLIRKTGEAGVDLPTGKKNCNNTSETLFKRLYKNFNMIKVATEYAPIQGKKYRYVMVYN